MLSESERIAARNLFYDDPLKLNVSRNGQSDRTRKCGANRRRRKISRKVHGCCFVGTLLMASRSIAYTTNPQYSGLFGSQKGQQVKYGRHTNEDGGLFQRQKPKRPFQRAATILRMVLTTPESIIEQASTQKLLDILIDESVRTTARRPIMMQVCFIFPYKAQKVPDIVSSKPSFVNWCIYQTHLRSFLYHLK